MVSFTGLLSNVIIAWFCCLLPAFQTFKALTNRPVMEPLLERWCKYWTIVGLIFAYQATIEQFVSWLPFYFEVKSLFLLFLALPQTEGSTYIYGAFLEPYLKENETRFDTMIDSVQSNTFAFATTQLQSLWQVVYRIISQAPTPAGAQPGQANPGQQENTAPPLGAIFGALKTYGPGFLNSFQAKAAPANTVAPTATASSVATPPAVPEQRTPYQADDQQTTPPFPEPQHFTAN